MTASRTQGVCRGALLPVPGACVQAGTDDEALYLHALAAPRLEPLP